MSWEAAIARLAGRVRLSIGRVVLGLVNDAAKLQAVQVTLRADEVRANAEHFQHYGFTSVPLPGAEGIGLAVGGSTDHVVVINVDDRRYRKTGLLPGETCLYTKWGDYILIREGEILVKHATKVVIDAPLVEMTGELHVVGDVIGAGKSLPHHTHQEQGDGAPTSPPI
jgi:phage baseplate assembly protein V